MKSITKKVPDVSAFAFIPDEPEKMDEKYPFMHNLFNQPNISSIPDPLRPGRKMVMAIGISDHMDPLENALCYGGILGRMLLTNNPDLKGKISTLFLVNFVKFGGVENADKKDGCLSVLWPKKTIRIRDKNNCFYEEDIDIQMIYIDTDKCKNPRGDEIAQMAWLLHGGDPDQIKIKELADIWKEACRISDSSGKDDVDIYKERLSIWEAFKDPIANKTIDIDLT